ncbi:hypothetical protein AX16_002352 [Volvariella volvacea WC 439]|nr:hypothetical protein AX16_002352 [Volvariella volvacea WC 439]
MSQANGSQFSEATLLDQTGDQTTPQTVSARRQPSSLRRRTNLTDVSRHSTASVFRRATLASMLIPSKPVGPAPTLRQSIRAVVCASYLNLLLVFIPISWALHFALPKSTEHRDTLIFTTSFIAIIPLAKLLAFATDELSMRVGQTLAGLMNATLGNAVELIVSIVALIKCELRIVQSSLIGSVLSNLLLVLGMCFFAGGTQYSEQGFGVSAVQLNSTLLTVSVIAVLLPAAFHLTVDVDDSTEARDILSVSRGVSIILLFIYASYLFFQLYSHAQLYHDSPPDIVQSIRYARRNKKSSGKKQDPQHTGPLIDLAGESGTQAPSNGSESTSRHQQENTFVEEGPTSDAEEEVETPSTSALAAIILLIIVTVLVAVTAEFLVDSIDGLTESGGIGKEFVGIILLPIVGNAAEHVTAVAVSVKNKLMLSLSVAVGSSIQIALFVIPFMVTLGWILGKPLTLLFDPLESITLFLSVLTVNYVVQDGKSNWLEGMILMCLYAILGVTFWYYPGSDPSGLLASCK